MANITSSKGREQRRARRYPAIREALLILQGKQLQGAIQDFCWGGFFVELREGLKSLRDYHRQGQTRIEIVFADAECTAAKFRLDARIVRITPNGIGLALQRAMPAHIYSDLGRPSKPAPADESKPLPAGEQSSLSAQAIACHRLFCEHLPILLRDFWKDLPAALLDAATNIKNNTEQNQFYEATTLLQQQYTTITQTFQSAALASAARFDPSHTSPVDVLAPGDIEEGHLFGRGANLEGDTELTLVGYDDMDDWVSLVAEIKRIKEASMPLLTELETRLAPVIPANAQNPFTPGMLGDALHQALGSLSLSPVVRRALYQLFRKTITPPLEQLYRAFLSELKPVTARARMPVRPASPAGPRPPGREEAPATDTTPVPAAAAVEQVPLAASAPSLSGVMPTTVSATPGAVVAVTGDTPSTIFVPPISSFVPAAVPATPATLGTAAISGSLAARAAGMVRSATGTGIAAETLDQGSGAAHSPARVFQGALSLLKAQGNLQTLQGVHSEGGYAVPPYSMAEVVAGLTGRLSAQMPYSSADTLELVREAGLNPDRLSTEQNQILELSAGLVQRILKESRLPPGFVESLAPLQGPLAHLAFTDSDFLQSDHHPAKQFLNLFDDLAIGVSDEGELIDSQLKQLLPEKIADIQQNYLERPEVFAEAAKALAPIAKRLAEGRVVSQTRVMEACEGKRRLLDTRQRVDQQNNQRIAGRLIPAVVRDLLAAGWQDLLALVALRNGLDSEAWATRFGVIERLLTWLDPQNPRPFEPGDAVHLIKVIETQITSLHQPRAITPLLDELTATLLGEGNPRVLRPPQLTAVPALPDPPQSAPSIGSSLRVGDWLEFETSQGSWRVLRLICAGEAGQEYVCVDRKGLKRLEISAQALKERLVTGKARLLENLDIPLVERITFGMMQEINNRLLQQTNQDPLTGMINRRGFLGALERHILDPQRRFGRHLLMVLELQRFRAINSNCGVEVGDKVIKLVADMVRTHLGPAVLIGRLGDTSFGALLMNQPLTTGTGQELARVLIGKLTQRRFRWTNQSFSIGAVIGLAEIEPRTISARDALKQADTACFIALQRGGDQIHYYQAEDKQQQQQEMLIQWAGRIDQVLQEDRLFLRTQRIQSLNQEDKHSHYEVLLGMRDENGKVLPPDEFLPAVEHWGKMPAIDKRVVELLFTWIRQDVSRLEKLGGFAVNLSGQSLNDPEMLVFLERQVKAAGFPMDHIIFEITESVALQGFHNMQDFIRQLRRHGCRFSLDDFGAGYSSYAYLKNLQVDYLKIDGSLIKDLEKNGSDRVVVRSINEVAHAMGLKTIAEYVENQAILDILTDIGVDYAQGYLVGKPCPLDTLTGGGGKAQEAAGNIVGEGI